MRPALKVVALGFVFYLIALIVTLPAGVVVEFLPPHIQLEGARGTFWEGRAARVTVNEFELGETHWETLPLALLTGRWKAQLDFPPPELQGDGLISVGFGPLQIQNADLAANATIFSPLIDAFGFGDRIAGRIELDLQSLRLADSGIRNLAGQLNWIDARLLFPRDLSLGDITVDLGQNSDTAVARMENTGGILELNGSGELQPGWRYQTQLRIKPNGRTPEDVRRALSFMGRPDAEGAVTLSQQGTLVPAPQAIE